MLKRHILDCIKKYSESDSVRLHMPGHKGKGDIFYENAEISVKGKRKSESPMLNGENLSDNGNNNITTAFGCDITELDFSDNLADSHGVIKMAEEDIARLCGAKRSFILTGGSSLGVLSMLYAVKDRGKKIIIARSSHKSVYNALKICNLEPIFLQEDISEGLPSPDFVNKNIIESCDNDVIGALITSPDYFGRVADLKYFSDNLKRRNKLLLIDGAHGSHLAFIDKNIYSGSFADIWVDGAHKTLETLTQGAILHVNDDTLIGKVRDALDIFSTSSPSYLIMSSVENGVKSFAEIRSGTFKKFDGFRQKIVKAIENQGFSIYPSDDKLKLTIDFNRKADGLKVAKYFEKEGIFVELASRRFMLFMLSPFLSERETDRIIAAIKNCPKKTCNYKNYFVDKMPKRVIGYNEVINMPCEEVLLKDANGFIAAENVGVFPPCYPLIVAGEIYDNIVIAALMVKNTFGVKDGKVRVLS